MTAEVASVWRKQVPTPRPFASYRRSAADGRSETSVMFRLARLPLWGVARDGWCMVGTDCSYAAVSAGERTAWAGSLAR